MADINDIKAILYTEKTQEIDGNVVVLKTTPRINKNNLKNLFKTYFNIVPLRINSLNQKGKKKRFKNHIGVKDNYKKFYVTMPEGANIEVLAT